MGKKVLIVDDEATLRNSLKAFLGVKGYQVETASNSAECFGLLDRFKPSLLILDLHLKEEITGVDILKKIKSIKYDIKIAVMTGFDDDESIKENCLRAGADIFLTKPATPGEVLQALQAMDASGT